MIKNRFYFKALMKKKLGIKKVFTFKTIKSLHDLQLQINPQNSSIITNTINGTHFHSIPKPKIICKITYEYHNLGDMPIKSPYESILKAFCGINIKYTDLKKSQLISRSKEIYPIELQDVLYKFALINIDSMNMDNLAQFQQLLHLGYDSNKNSLLLRKITEEMDYSSDIVSNNMVFFKLLEFIIGYSPSSLSNILP